MEHEVSKCLLTHVATVDKLDFAVCNPQTPSSCGFVVFGEALALMLEDGQDGVPQDTEAALKWHLAAAEQGNALILGLTDV